MVPTTKILDSLGLTRDSFALFVSKWCAFILALAAMGTDITKVGIPEHYAPYIAGIALFISVSSAQHRTSDLPGANDAYRVTPPKASIWLLAMLLGGGLLGAGVTTSSCASSAAVHAAVVVDNTLAQTLHAVKQDELAAYHAGTYDKAQHQTYAKAILAALQAGNALNDAIDTWRQAAPGTPAPQIVATTIAGLQQIVTDLSGILPATNPLLVDVQKVLAFIGPILK